MSSALMRPAVLVATPRGSTIEISENGRYWACDSGRNCHEVNSLWRAQQLIQRAELLHQPIDALIDALESP
jgi:hypothetical protein